MHEAAPYVRQAVYVRRNKKKKEILPHSERTTKSTAARRTATTSGPCAKDHIRRASPFSLASINPGFVNSASYSSRSHYNPRMLQTP